MGSRGDTAHKGRVGGEPVDMSLEKIELGSHLPQLSPRHPVCRSYFVVVTLCIAWWRGVAKAGREKRLDAREGWITGGRRRVFPLCLSSQGHTTHTQHTKHNTDNTTHSHSFLSSLAVLSFHCTTETDRGFSYLFLPPSSLSLSLSLFSSPPPTLLTTFNFSVYITLIILYYPYPH